MTTGEKTLLISIVIVTMCLTAAVTYTVGHNNGVEHGAALTKQYHEATGEFPSQRWLDDFERTHFEDPQQIIDSLNPYGAR